MAFFNLTLTTDASLHPECEPDEFVSEHHGVITCVDERDVLTKVGRVRALRMHAGLAIERGESLADVCDAHSDELLRLLLLLYTPTGYSFKEPLVRRFEAVEWDLLILDYVILSPKWQGLKVGLLAARKMVDRLGGGCGLVVSNISPIRNDAHAEVRVPPRWLPQHKDDIEERTAATKLRVTSAGWGSGDWGGRRTTRCLRPSRRRRPRSCSRLKASQDLSTCRTRSTRPSWRPCWSGLTWWGWGRSEAETNAESVDSAR